MIDKRRLALFPAGTFITPQAKFEPALNGSSGFVE